MGRYAACTMSKREASKSHQPVSGGIVGSPVFWIAVIVVAVGGMIWLALPRTSQPAAASLAPAPAADAGTTAEVIPDKILGRWMRNEEAAALDPAELLPA